MRCETWVDPQFNNDEGAAIPVDAPRRRAEPERIQHANITAPEGSVSFAHTRAFEG